MNRIGGRPASRPIPPAPTLSAPHSHLLSSRSSPGGSNAYSIECKRLLYLPSSGGKPTFRVGWRPSSPVALLRSSKEEIALYIHLVELSSPGHRAKGEWASEFEEGSYLSARISIRVVGVGAEPSSTCYFPGRSVGPLAAAPPAGKDVGALPVQRGPAQLGPIGTSHPSRSSVSFPPAPGTMAGRGGTEPATLLSFRDLPRHRGALLNSIAEPHRRRSGAVPDPSNGK